MAKRILIADDSVTIQKAFAMTFAGADDVTVSGARSADEGLALAQRTHPDLIIADGVMPGRSGYDLCASVKADPALRAVPVLILASSQQPYDDARGQKAGADGQLTKPWETNAMMEKVRDVLRGGRVGAPAGVTATAPPAAPAPGRSAASLPTAAIDDDEYGEISIDTGRESIPTIPRAPAAAPPAAAAPSSGGRISSPSMPAVPAAPAAAHPHPAAPPPASTTSPGMRPSLIPGMRPGAMPPARPGSTAPVRPLAGAPLPTTAPPRPAAQPVGRTLMGVPAANIPIPGVMRPSMPSMPAIPSHAPPPAAPPPRQPTGPAAPLETRPRLATPPPRQRLVTPPPAPPARMPTPVAQATISASVEQKLAALSAKGPEYEAIAKLSREIIEQVVWEVVPELAEAIIREHVKNKGIG
jgi:CheY-like chemotaxis protein